MFCLHLRASPMRALSRLYIAQLHDEYRSGKPVAGTGYGARPHGRTACKEIDQGVADLADHLHVCGSFGGDYYRPRNNCADAKLIKPFSRTPFSKRGSYLFGITLDLPL